MASACVAWMWPEADASRRILACDRHSSTAECPHHAKRAAPMSDCELLHVTLG